MINVVFNSETGILESQYVGEITLNQVVKYINATRENTTYPRKMKILSNAIDSQFDFTDDDLASIVAANNSSLEQYDCIIDAIVIDSPREAALTFLYQQLAANRKYRFKIFSTVKGAEMWLEKE